MPYNDPYCEWEDVKPRTIKPKRELIDDYGGFGGSWYWWNSHCSNCDWKIDGATAVWRKIRFWLHHCKKEPYTLEKAREEAKKGIIDEPFDYEAVQNYLKNPILGAVTKIEHDANGLKIDFVPTEEYFKLKETWETHKNDPPTILSNEPTEEDTNQRKLLVSNGTQRVGELTIYNNAEFDVLSEGYTLGLSGVFKDSELIWLILSPMPALEASAEYNRGFRDGCAQGNAGHEDIVRGLENEINRLRLERNALDSNWAEGGD